MPFFRTWIDQPSVDISDMPSGTLRLVASTEVTSDTTSVSFTNLDINTDKMYVIICNVKNNTASTSSYNLFINSDTTTTNYYTQLLQAAGTALSANRFTSPQVLYLTAGTRGVSTVKVFLDADSYLKCAFEHLRDTGSGILYVCGHVSKTASVTNITQIDIQASITNAISAGSTFALYKCDY